MDLESLFSSTFLISLFHQPFYRVEKASSIRQKKVFALSVTNFSPLFLFERSQNKIESNNTESNNTECKNIKSSITERDKIKTFKTKSKTAKGIKTASNNIKKEHEFLGYVG
jgi:hypothetical protein